MKAQPQFKTLTDFTDHFYNEETCVQHYTATRFANGEFARIAIIARFTPLPMASGIAASPAKKISQSKPEHYSAKASCRSANDS